MFQYILAFVSILFSVYISYKIFYNKKYIKQNDRKYIIDKNITLIGITGRKGSGKDTIGKYLVEKYNFKRLAFADPLKDACKIIFGLTDEQLYDNKKKEVIDNYWKYTPRYILQKVGTELFRNTLSKELKYISKDIWIRSVEKSILDNIKKGYNKFVITDVRFYNEHNFITDNNGTIIKVIRPSLMNDKNIHSSEIMTDYFPADITLVNNGDIIDLYNLFEHEIEYCNKLSL